MKRSTKDNVVLYHVGCNDGIASAWCAYGRLGEEADYFPYQYGDKLPDLLGKMVYVLDLSLPMDVIESLQHVVKGLVIVDHHKTAIDKLQELRQISTCTGFHEAIEEDHRNNIWAMTDIRYSGAVLSSIFFGDALAKAPIEVAAKEVPWIVKVIHDYDLWKFELPSTLEINTWLSNGPRTIERFNSMLKQDGTVFNHIIEAGRGLVEYDNGIVKTVVKNYIQYVPFKHNDVWYEIPVINGPHHLRNAIAEHLIETTGVPFVIIYNERTDKTVFSIRSDGYDVSNIAKRFNGGGHREAAAFVIANTGPRLQLSAILNPPSFFTRLKKAWKILRGELYV